MANIFVNLTEAQQVECIDTIVDAVLSTDISRHFELTSHISAKIQHKDFKLPTEKLEERRLCTMSLLKMADISNPMKPFSTAAWWADVVLREFHAQGDLEVSLGLPISPLCDRETGDLATSQLGFSQFVVRPFYSLCSQLMSGIEPILDICDENISIWNQKKEQTRLEQGLSLVSRDEVEDLKGGRVIGLDRDAMQGMADEDVAIHILQAHTQNLAPCVS